jgi:hypothetical protein
VVGIHDMPNEDHNAVDVTAAPAGWARLPESNEGSRCNR